jgi:hypothetical protein
MLQERCDFFGADSGCDVLDTKIRKSLNINSLLEKANFFEDKNVSGENILMSLSRLVLDLEQKIPEYETIISDDAGGRMISLFLREVVNIKRKDLNLPLVKTFFLAGSAKQETIDDFIYKKSDSLGKTLVVTESIITGENVRKFMKPLEKKHIDFDIASLTVGNCDRLTSEEFLDLSERFYGDLHNSNTGFAFCRVDFNGVNTWINSDKHPHPQKNCPINQEKVNLARENIKVIAREISKLV